MKGGEKCMEESWKRFAEEHMDRVYDLAVCDDCYNYECSMNDDFCEYKIAEGSCPIQWPDYYD
jgi:hypothetical protein